MEVEIRYFAAAREATGIASETLALEAGTTVVDLAALLAERHAALADVLPTLRFAQDEAFADGADAVRDGAVVALIPPVGGG